jgi:prepilin-type processing-associated H-X9-DG protein
MGSGSGIYLTPGNHLAKEGWSIHAALLPALGEMPIYNAINFSWNVDPPNCNTTVFYTRVKEFLCPSDPNAFAIAHDNTSGNNCYFGSIGATTDILAGGTSSAPSLANVPTTGLFAFQQSKKIAAVIDGTSNTVAFAESTVGNPGAQARQKLAGLVNVGLPAGALQSNAFANPPAVMAGIAACSARWNTSTDTPDLQRGDTWCQGAMCATLFNTIVTPNGQNDTWAYCSSVGSGGVSNISNADSYHPGGVSVLMGDGSVKFIKDSVNQAVWWSLGSIGGGEVISSDSY